MNMLVHRITDSPELPFVLDDLKMHLRILHEDDDPAITKMGHTAAAEIEQFAQIALLTQTIRVTIFDPGMATFLKLPIGPVADDEVPTVTIDGDAFSAFELIGGNRPVIRWLSGYPDTPPSRMTITYQAGFGATAADIPADLAQALMDQTALHFDGRSPMDAKSLTTSPHMARIGARYRGVQL